MWTVLLSESCAGLKVADVRHLTCCAGVFVARAAGAGAGQRPGQPAAPTRIFLNR